MRSRRLALAGLAGVLALGGAAVLWQAVRTPSAAARPGELHTFLHIGCKHHNHGPKWHQDHGRILGARGRVPLPDGN